MNFMTEITFTFTVWQLALIFCAFCYLCFGLFIAMIFRLREGDLPFIGWIITTTLWPVAIHEMRKRNTIF